MPSTKNILAYTTHARVLDTALDRPGIRLTLETPKASMKWRQEANYYRTLLRKSGGGMCKYDCLIIKLDTLNKSTIVIEHRDEEIGGVLTDLEGNEIVPVTPAAEPEGITLSLDDKLNIAVALEIEDD